MLELLAQLGDDDELIEIQENYAPNMITAFGRSFSCPSLTA